MEVEPEDDQETGVSEKPQSGQSSNSNTGPRRRRSDDARDRYDSDDDESERRPRKKRRHDDDDDEDDLDDDESDRRPKKRRRYADDDDSDDDIDVRKRRPHSRRSKAASRVMGPAIALMICGSIGFAWFIIAAVLAAIGTPPPEMREPGAYRAGQICGVLTLGLINAAVIHGAYQMWCLKNYRNAMACAIVSVIPLCSPCYLLGIPFGIWAIVVLLDQRVKFAFDS